METTLDVPFDSLVFDEAYHDLALGVVEEVRVNYYDRWDALPTVTFTARSLQELQYIRSRFGSGVEFSSYLNQNHRHYPERYVIQALDKR